MRAKQYMRDHGFVMQPNAMLLTRPLLSWTDIMNTENFLGMYFCSYGCFITTRWWCNFV